VVKGVAGKEGIQQKKCGTKKYRNELKKADAFQVSTGPGRKDVGKTTETRESKELKRRKEWKRRQSCTGFGGRPASEERTGRGKMGNMGNDWNYQRKRKRKIGTKD
jgi:hypothetical protein